MKRNIIPLLGFALAITFVAFVGGQPAAMEETPPGKNAPQGEAKAENAFASCNKWVNCNSESPNFTGLCCRTCKDVEGQTIWDCKPVSSDGESYDASEGEIFVVCEATLTGIVTAEGLLKADDGRNYKIAGARMKVDELKRNLGAKIEVKGAVQEVDGKATIEVKSYKSVYSEIAAPNGDDLSSCTSWLNCDRRPPNYTGTCCRRCDDNQGGKVWDCQVFSGREHFDMAEWSKQYREFRP